MKQLLCLFLCAALCLACLTGCQSAKDNASSNSAKNQQTAAPDSAPAGSAAAPAPSKSGMEPVPSASGEPAAVQTGMELGEVQNLGFTAFDNRLIAFLKQKGLSEKNFTVSPLSFKAALALAALGAEGETQAQLLSAMGFETIEDAEAWYADVLSGVDRFSAYFSSPMFGDRGDAAYEVVNSVWKNEDLPGEFKADYLEAVQKGFRAWCGSASAAELTQAINGWVKEKTRGLIPSLLEDASRASAVLVNALYLKAGWENPFHKIGADDFTDISGQTVTKDYMQVTGSFFYYADDETQLVSVPLQGGMYMLFVLGDDTDLAEKLAKAESRRVEVTVPLFDVETTLNRGELCEYLISGGCSKAFTDAAEFGPMFTESLCVDDIIQKAKVHIDEEGLEAAAATAIMMRNTAVMPTEAVAFRADRAFSFYIVNSLDSPELLFWGQLVH